MLEHRHLFDTSNYDIGTRKREPQRELGKHEACLACLTDNCIMRHMMNLVRNYGHQLYSVTMNIISLSQYDDKR